MFGYFSLVIICSSKLTVFLELCSRKTVRFSEQIMSPDKYPSIFFVPNGDYCLYKLSCRGVIIFKTLISDLFAANVLIRRSYIKYFQFQISCLSRVPRCNNASAIAPQFLFVLLYITCTFLLFCQLLLLTPPPLPFRGGGGIIP